MRTTKRGLVVAASMLSAASAQAQKIGAGGPGNMTRALVGGAVSSSSFSPLQIGNALLWLEGGVGVFKDAGTTPAGDGDTIQQWNDQSIGANNASQATGGSRPTSKAGILNGNAVVRCDGSSSFMSAGNIFPVNQSYTMDIVSVMRGTSSGNLVSGTDGSGRAFFYNSTNFINVWQGGAMLTASTATGVGTTAVHELGAVARTNSFSNTLSYNLAVNGNFNSGEATYTPNADAALNICSLGNAFFYNGDIAEILIYSKILRIDQTNSLHTYINGKFATTLPIYASTKQIVFDGDSITAGLAGQPPFAMLIGVNEGAYTVNLGSAGIQMAELVTQAASYVDPLFASGVSKNIDVVFAGTNDIVGGASAATVYANFQSYCAARHAVGWKVVVVPMLPRDAGAETQRTAYNASLASDGCADAKVPTSCSFMWNASENTNATYYAGDQIHPNTTGHSLIAPCIQTAIDSL